MSDPIVGQYHVEMDWLDAVTGDVLDEEYIQPIGIVGDEYEQIETGLFNPDGTKSVIQRVIRECPKVSNKAPYEGGLTAHELSFVRGMPGKDFNFRLRFRVTEKGA